MIVGRYFGWSAVSREPMNWTEYHLARQLLAEDTVGRHARAAEGAEDAEFAAAKALLSRG